MIVHKRGYDDLYKTGNCLCKVISLSLRALFPYSDDLRQGHAIPILALEEIPSILLGCDHRRFQGSSLPALCVSVLCSLTTPGRSCHGSPVPQFAASGVPVPADRRGAGGLLPPAEDQREGGRGASHQGDRRLQKGTLGLTWYDIINLSRFQSRSLPFGTSVDFRIIRYCLLALARQRNLNFFSISSNWIDLVGNDLSFSFYSICSFQVSISGLHLPMKIRRRKKRNLFTGEN